MRHGADLQPVPVAMLCREMELRDCAAVAALLTVGFRAWRDRAFWDRSLARLADRVPPSGLPQMGYVLETDGAIVGVLLVIAAETASGARTCNLSSWYVEPAFSLYGALLVRRALRHRDVTFLNVTPAPETWDLLAAQGYSRFSVGRWFTLPLLGWRGAIGSAARFDRAAAAGLSEHERALLASHAAWGCVSVVCAGREPFIFGLRRRRAVVPFAYLIHCRSLDSFTAHARALGVFLLRHGVVLVVADAEARLGGVPGWFKDGFPKFFRGATAPAAHDLAYTERAIFGV